MPAEQGRGPECRTPVLGKMCLSVILALGGGDRRIAGSSRFSERPVSEQKMVGDGGRHPHLTLGNSPVGLLAVPAFL